jgi:hypothetical protein
MRQTRPWIMLIVAFAVVLAASSPLVAQVNLLVNPGFEDLGGSYDGWLTFGEGVQLSLPDGDNIIHTGSAAAKIYGEFTTCPGNPQFDVGGFGQVFTPTEGMIYELSGYVYVSSGDPMVGTDVCTSNRLLAKIVFFDAVEGGNEIQSNELIIGNFDTPVDEWLAFTVSTPAPEGALRVEALFLFLQPACDEGAVYVDDVTFYELTPPTPPANMLVNPSFDTDLSAWNIFGNVYYDGRYWAFRTRTGCAKLYGPFAVPGDASGMYQSFATAPGTEYQFDVYSMSTCMETPVTGSNDNYAVAKIVFRDGGGVEMGSNETVIGDSSMTLGTWTLHTVTATAPEGSATVEPYILFVQPTSMGGAIWVDDLSFYEAVITGDTPEPLNVELHQNVPNPFNPVTRIDFNLRFEDTVDLAVYDVTGRLVATLLRGRVGVGMHHVTWDGKADNGIPAASGVYWYVLRTSTERMSRAMVLLR